MRLAVFADVHGNIGALEAILEDADRRGAEGAVHLGDLVGQQEDAGSAEAVVRLLRQRGVPGVVGDRDLAYLEDPPPSDSHGSPPVQEFLRNLPAQLAYEEGGLRLLFAHASPEGPEEGGLAELPEADLHRFLERCGADVLVVGHTHRALARRAGNRLLLNPGSGGCLGDPGDPRVSYLLLDTAAGLEVSHVRIQIGVESRPA